MMPESVEPPVLAHLLEQNARWAAGVIASDPYFFINSAKNPQTPKVLWLGCADSRVPESVIMACKPGDVFTTRNIANQFHLEDLSAAAVLSYAVEHIGVQYVIVCGHTGCGGVSAAYDIAMGSPHLTATATKTPSPGSPLDLWLAPLVKLALDLHLPPAPPEVALPILTKANISRQIENIKKAAAHMIPKAEEGVSVHGWLYVLDKGLLQDLNASSALK